MGLGVPSMLRDGAMTALSNSSPAKKSTEDSSATRDLRRPLKLFALGDEELSSSFLPLIATIDSFLCSVNDIDVVVDGVFTTLFLEMTDLLADRELS
jgi:hypothetical protein